MYGEYLRQQVEDRLKFYETGEAPKKNLDVMHEAVQEVMVKGNMHLIKIVKYLSSIKRNMIHSSLYLCTNLS